MAPHVNVTKSATNVLVHHQSTGKIEVRRLRPFSGNSHPNTGVESVHFTGTDRRHVCLCNKTCSHLNPLVVASVSSRLATALTYFLSSHNLTSCSIAQWQEYYTKRKLEWAHIGVKVDDFHYVTQDKDVVCRCSRGKIHGYSPVHHSEIIELCAHFFVQNREVTKCSQAQWRSLREHKHDKVAEQPSNNAGELHTGKADWKYKTTAAEAETETHGDGSPQSPPFQETGVSSDYISSKTFQPMLHGHQAKTIDSEYQEPEGSATRTPTVKKHDTPPLVVVMKPQRHIHAASMTQCRLRTNPRDIPTQVWSAARPSVHSRQCGLGSETSTSLGTESSRTRSGLRTSIAHLATPSNTGDSASVFNDQSFRFSLVSSLSSFANGTGSEDGDDLTAILRGQPEISQRRSEDFSTGLDAFLGRKIQAQVCEPSDLKNSMSSQTDSTSIVAAGEVSDDTDWELGALRKQLDALAKKSYSDYVTDPSPENELVDSSASSGHQGYRIVKSPEKPFDQVSKDTTKVPETSVSQGSSDPLSRLDSLFEDIRSTLDMPSQADILKQQTIKHSGQHPPLQGGCPHCKSSLQENFQTLIQLPSCKHYVHLRCLALSFRMRDQSIGRCPVCELALCERTLADCIDLDCLFIFGPSRTLLQDSVSLELAHGEATVTVHTEQQLAAAQLRQLKEYIVVHAEDIRCTWRPGQPGPTWETAVIRPALDLFRGWTSPTKQSHYLSDDGAFLELLAWADLVRFMNLLEAQHVKAHYTTAFPPLVNLHAGFASAQARYEATKAQWRRNNSRMLACDVIAQDAVDIARGTYYDGGFF